MRYFVQFSYVGTNYHGWQKQPNAVTIQSVMENAFSKLLGEAVVLVGAGRTDTGVHARQLFAHFDFHGIDDVSNLVYRLNAFLPDDIAVQGIMAVPDDAHARFHAIERTYEYWVVQEKNPFLSNSAYYVKYPLGLAHMNEAAAVLTEYTDFECFSKSNTDVKTFRCDVRSALWKWENDRLVFTITADRFLRNMVRAVVGTLIEVGKGNMEPADIRKVITSKNRSEAGPSVPAKGLYLTRVTYPDEILK